MIGGSSIFTESNSVKEEIKRHTGLYSAILLRAIKDSLSSSKSLREESQRFLESEEGQILISLVGVRK